MTSPILDRLPEATRRQIRMVDQPEWVPPMLATLTERRFSSEDWIYERKLDGERALVLRNGRKVSLLSRNRGVLNSQYPELIEAFSSQEASRFVADGEIVAFERGRTSFARLQRRMHVIRPWSRLIRDVPVEFYAFDLIHLDGYDISALGCRDRKAALRLALTFKSPLRYTAHKNKTGESYWQEACRKGWEGVIAKRAAAPYVGRRSADWLKFKCMAQQEFVIGGYTDPKGSRRGFGALLIGYYERGELVYAGKVGTGFDDAQLDRLGARLHSLQRRSSPFDRGRPPTKDMHWVRPQLVGQVGFSEWTGAGQLRHPRFLGLRTDKEAKDVVRELPGA
jgi:bifunctional non-homologous end joining protein LigD